MPHNEVTPEPEEGIVFTDEENVRLQSLVDESRQNIIDRSPPHKILVLNFTKSLRLTAAILLVMDQSYSTGTYDCAIKAAEIAIREETATFSLARAFWLARLELAEAWTKEEDRSIPFSDAEYTSSNAVLDSCFTVRDIYPLVNNFSTNFKSNGQPRHSHFVPKPTDASTGPKDKKATIIAARDRAHAEFGALRTKAYQDCVRAFPEQEGSPKLLSRSPSVEVVAGEDYDANGAKYNGVDEFEDDFEHEGKIIHDDAHDYEEDVVLDRSPTPHVQQVRSRRRSPIPNLQSRLGALVDSDFEDFGDSPPPAPRRSREAFSPPAQQQVAVRPVVRSKRSAAKVQYHSDSSDDSEGGGTAGSEAPLTPYEATLHRLHQSRMEPVAGRAALTGLALETYCMAQATRGFNKKLFKDTIAASQLPIHPRILEAIAKNEAFDFTCLNVTDALGEPEPLAIAALPGVFTAGKPPSRPIESGLQWAKAWGLYIAARRQWYAWEVPALEKFGEWFINRLDEKGYFEQYLAFFAERFPKRSSATSRIPALRRAKQHQDHRRPHQATQIEFSPETKFANDGTKATSIIPAVAAMFALSVTQANTARTLVRNSEEWEKTNQGRGFEDVPKELPLFPPNSEDHPSDCFPLAGTSSIPRLRRNLHFPVTTKPSSPSVDATLTDRPLPSVPSQVLNDPNINATLRARPDLFNVSTPIDIPRFKNLLATHPNRPLVDSVLHGLEFGFWPGHDGDFSKIAHLSGPALRLNDKTLDFLSEHSAEDFEKGYLSESFDKLLPGMHVSPDYATDPVNQRPRPINDLTASGLNDGVSKAMAKVRYDAQAELGAIARYRFRKGDLKDPIADPVFWKSDVSGGFRNLPVSPYWQVKQVHRVRIRSGKKFIWVYRVDQRLMLGGRMSPRIFCTFMSLVLWATRREFALAYPIAFVDDTFGLDANGLRIPITHYLTKETRLVCLEQAKVLTMWNYLHFPWSWTKQPMGKSLIIIGNVFSLVTANDGSISDMTISLAPESVELYATDVRNFLYRADGRPKLKEWLAIQGYSSWAVGVMHWGRFALECLYEKTAGKAFQWLPLSMNDVVRQDLNWFVKELREAPPLSLLDPALEHWGVNDAHVILHTDACLLTVDKKSSGLGFWTKVDGKRRHFSHRTKDRWNDIRWAEALAVFSAINWAIDNTEAKRIMIFTDSALCVYAFDAGKVALGPMHDLVWSVYARLAEKGIDLRLRHVSGEANKTADFLSRATNEKLIEKYGSSVSSFAPPTHLLGGPSR